MCVPCVYPNDYTSFFHHQIAAATTASAPAASRRGRLPLFVLLVLLVLLVPSVVPSFMGAPSRHFFPQSLHVMNTIIGSSALRVCSW